MTEVDRFQRVSRLFDEARALPPGERTAFVARARGDDQSIRDEVDALLSEHERDGGALDHPLGDALDLMRQVTETAAGVEQIGGYRIVRKLGEGGMGVVWLAEQDHPRREVALKVIRPGLAGRELLRRFELEATVLGRLKHVGIAQIYEAGLHDDGSGGRPFFAMEHVDGATLIEYAKQSGLGLRARLELFTRVCDAVHHAHQKGVIHRDLKPGNILVVDGQPKVLDFGVARATDSDLQATTQRTGVGQLIGTLPYMSPEQLEGRSESLDTRSDVYALGVILYELLAERLPHDLTDLTIVKAARVISEDTPVPLGSISRTYRGDLNTVVLKALEKDPERRYASASDLAADVWRYLDNEPIVARPATTMYQLRKFARRNRGLVAGIVAAFVALAAGAGAAIAGMMSAQQAAARALATNAFMQDVLTSADERRDVRLVEVLREAGDEAAERFDDPELEADVRFLLADSFSHLTLNEDAEVHARRAHEIRRATLGPDHEETQRAGLLHASVLLSVPRLDEATQVAEEVLEHAQRREARGEIALRARRELAKIRGLKREYVPALAELRELRAIARDRFGPDRGVSITMSDTLAWLLRVRAARGASDDVARDYAEAIELSRDVLGYHRRDRGDAASATLWAMNDLAEALRLAGRPEEAGPLFEEALLRAPPRVGEDHGICTEAANGLSRVRWGQRRFDEAADLRIRAIASQRARVGDTPGVFSKMSDGLPFLHAAGRNEVGAAYAGTLHDRFAAVLGPEAALTLRYRAELGSFLSEQGKTAEAGAHFDEIIELESGIDDDVARRRIDLYYGSHLARLGRHAEAERRLLASLDRPAELYSEAWLVETTHAALARLYDDWGKPAEAARWRE